MKRIIKIKAVVALLLVVTFMVGCSLRTTPQKVNAAVREDRLLTQVKSPYNVVSVGNNFESKKSYAVTAASPNSAETTTILPTSVFNTETRNSSTANTSVGSNHNTATIPIVLSTESLSPTAGIATINFAYETPDGKAYSKALPIADDNCEHNWTYTNNTIHHDAKTHTETVTVNEPWDEKVLVKAAWDEKVLTKNAWDEKKLVKDAWDEKMLVKAAYDETVKNGSYFVEAIWLQGCDGNAAALGYSSPYDYLRDYYSNEDEYYLEYDSGYKTYPERHLVHTYNEAADLMMTNSNVKGFISGGWYNVYAYNTYDVYHEAEYKTIHHNAKYQMIHHDAEYETIHHDAEYRTIHHDTKSEQKTVVDKPAYDTYQTIFKCSKCQKTY